MRRVLPLRLALPAVEPFLAENVAKEIRKDGLVIRRAAEGSAPGAAREILAAARQVDREFLERIGELPVRIAIPYARIEPVRLRRIELGLDTAGRILQAWRAGRRVREAFEPQELERRLRELLRLYAEETTALGDCVRLPRLLAPLREALEQRLREAMADAADRISRRVREA